MQEAATQPVGVTSKNIDLWFEGRPLSSSQQNRYSNILRSAKALSVTILENVPPGPDQTAAIRDVRQACAAAYDAILTGQAGAAG